MAIFDSAGSIQDIKEIKIGCINPVGGGGGLHYQKVGGLVVFLGAIFTSNGIF